MKRRFFFSLSMLIVGFVIVNPLSSPAQTPSSNDKNPQILKVENNLQGFIVTEGEKPWTLKERMEHYKVPAVSIAVIKDYKIDWAKAYGYADLSEKTPATTQTLFQAASISKSLNAMGVIKLAQDKKIDLKADINTYLKVWKFPYDSLSKGKKINTTNLLSHTAGLTVHGFAGYDRKEQLPTIIQILNGEKPANSAAIRSKSEPEQRFEYSGGGTTISQLMVTDITGLAYEKYMSAKVLKPLGMSGSFYSQSPEPGQQKYLSTAHNRDGKAIEGRYHHYPEMAAAALWTNPSDLAKFVIETELSLKGKSNKVLSVESTKLMLTPYVGKSNGLGVFIDEKGGLKYFQHGGSNAGFRCQYFGSLEGGNGVVIMINSDNGEIIPEIVNSVATVYQWKDFYQPQIKKLAEVSEDVLQSYVGEYQITPQFILTITREGKQLKGQATGQPVVDLFPGTPNKFFLKVVQAELEFVKDESGLVNKAILYQGGQKVEAKRIK